MTNKEAIEILHIAQSVVEWEYPMNCAVAFDMAIEALDLLEPRKPEKTILEYEVNGEIIKINHPECPRCRENGLVLFDAAIPRGDKFCKRCGQAIDWEEE